MHDCSGVQKTQSELHNVDSTVVGKIWGVGGMNAELDVMLGGGGLKGFWGEVRSGDSQGGLDDTEGEAGGYKLEGVRHKPYGEG